MSPAALPASVVTFVHGCIDSVEQLAVLALLSDQPEKEWTTTTLSQELRSTETSVEKRLSSLARAKVLEPIAPGASFRYSPCSPEVAATVQAVVKV